MTKSMSFFDSILSPFRSGFGGVFQRFFGGKNGRESKNQKIEKPHETLRVRIEFEGRLLETKLKNLNK